MTVDRLLSVDDVAAFEQVTPRTVREQVKAGLLPVIRINARVLRFRQAEIEAALLKLRIPARGERSPHGT